MSGEEEGLASVARQLHCRVGPRWARECQSQLGGVRHAGPQQVLQLLLHSDLNTCGVAHLPPNVKVRSMLSAGRMSEAALSVALSPCSLFSGPVSPCDMATAVPRGL